MVGVTAVGSWSGIFLFRQKTAYEMRISDWSSDVCSSDLGARKRGDWDHVEVRRAVGARAARDEAAAVEQHERALDAEAAKVDLRGAIAVVRPIGRGLVAGEARIGRSEEHTSELQSLMRSSYVVFCLKKKNRNNKYQDT